MSDETTTRVLFVDLDGTLVATDVLQEALWLAATRRPLLLVRFLMGAMRGRAVAKRSLAQHIQPAPESLPYVEEVLTFLHEEQARGCRLVLATASDAVWAQAVACHVGCFDDVLASDGQRNLKGAGKLQAIRSYCQEHGFDSFAYIGDAEADLPIWEHAAGVYVVAPTARLLASLRRLKPPARIFPGRRPHLRPVLRALGLMP